MKVLGFIKRNILIFAIALATAFLFVTETGSAYASELTVYVDGDAVCSVENIEVIDKALEFVECEMSDRLGYQYKFERCISYRESKYDSGAVLGEDELSQALLKIAELDYLDAFTLYVDGYVIGVFSEIDQEMLTKKMGEYLSKLTPNKDSALHYNLESTYAKREDIISLERFFDALDEKLDGCESDVTDALQLLQSIVLPKSDEYLEILPGGDESGTQIVIKHEEVFRDIPYKTVYIDSNDIPFESILVKSEGCSGLEKNVYEVRYVNGEEVSRTLITSEVLLECTDREVYIGVNKCAPYGEFVWPTTGYISSGYGYRTLNGKREFHYGIDIATKKGTPVCAADGGIVIYSGYNSSYGYYVLIDHGEYITCYAHMSKILVKKGEEVYRTQQIGKVGSTGYSFGNHLHFEIRKADERINPLDFINKSELKPTV